MNTGIIELEEARELLLRAMETQGRDFQYQTKVGYGHGCLNVPLTEELSGMHGIKMLEDDPKAKTGCIVGTALSLSGRDLPLKERCCMAVTGFAEWLSGDALSYLSIAQMAQDNMQTWGEAYDRAESYIGRLSVGLEETYNWKEGVRDATLQQLQAV